MILCLHAPDQQLASFSFLSPFIGCHSVEKGTTEESVLMTQNVDYRAPDRSRNSEQIHFNHVFCIMKTFSAHEAEEDTK